jgi:hypothetical protein
MKNLNKNIFNKIGNKAIGSVVAVALLIIVVMGAVL